jgi:hypothetical protein
LRRECSVQLAAAMASSHQKWKPKQTSIYEN